MDRASTDALAREWCLRSLGSAAIDVIFRAGHLSAVLGLRLGDGRTVVVKVRPAGDRLADCVRLQAELADRGYPCPRPVTAVEIVNGLAVHAEEYRPDGDQLGSLADRPRLFAAALADLTALAPPPEYLPALAQPLPWLAGGGTPFGKWPEADDLDVDLNQFAGPDWLDGMAYHAQEYLARDHGPRIVGHGDWELQNLRWVGRQLYCVHDWDSAVIHSEAVIAGTASAVFTADGRAGTEPSIEESRAFLEEYRRRRRLDWGTSELHIAWAAGLWVRAFNAKKDFVRGGAAAIAPVEAALRDRLNEVTRSS